MEEDRTEPIPVRTCGSMINTSCADLVLPTRQCREKGTAESDDRVAAGLACGIVRELRTEGWKPKEEDERLPSPKIFSCVDLRFKLGRRRRTEKA